MIIHTVKPGDTAYSIAKSYGISPDRLIIDNGISGLTERLPTGLGLVIRIPEVRHTVRSGETLFGIAREYGTTVGQLFRNNLILGGNPGIYEGQTLVIEYTDKALFSYDIGGYAYTTISDSLLNEVLPFSKLIMPFTYGFTLSGELVRPDDNTILKRASVYGTRPYMHLSTLTENGSFSSELATELLSDKSLWKVLADSIISEIKEKGYLGLDVDFEYLSGKNRIPYAEFAELLHGILSENGCTLTVALPPKVRADQPGTLYEGADYGLLGKAADHVLLMTYEWGYAYGPPLPVSPTPSLKRVLDYAVTEIERDKIYMGISNYGYDWTLPYVSGTSRARSLSNTEAVMTASENRAEIQYSTEYEAPFFYYTDAFSNRHVVWFEDARSIYAKLLIINDYGFFGGLYWNFDRKNPQNLAVLSSVIQYDKT